MKKKDKHIGQLPLDKIEQNLEEEILRTDRPKGMPSLAAIKTEVAKFGLQDVDAEHMFDIWLLNGFTLKGGKKVQNWKAAVRVWHRNEYFPSQRKAAKFKPVDNKARMIAQMERMQANAKNNPDR